MSRNKRREVLEAADIRSNYRQYHGSQDNILGRSQRQDDRIAFANESLSRSTPSVSFTAPQSPSRRGGGRDDRRSRSPARKTRQDGLGMAPVHRDSRPHNRSPSPARRTNNGRSNRGQSPGREPRGRGNRGQSPGRYDRAQSPGRNAGVRYDRGKSPSRGNRSQSPNRGVRYDRNQFPDQNAAARNNRSQSPNRRSRGRSPSRGTREQNYGSQSPGRHNGRRSSQSSSVRELDKYIAQPVGHRYEPRHGQEEGNIRYFDAATLEEETSTARLEVLSITIHILVIGASMMITIPMAQVTIDWQYVRRRCPLFVDNNPQTDVNWGNENMAPCNVTAFLPLLVAVLSACLAFFHCSILHAWRMRGDPPVVAFSTKYALATMVVTGVQAALSLAIACTLTDGFRQTCLSFELNPWPDVRPGSCKEGYDDRDFSYRLQDLHTHSKIVIGMVGAWFCTVATAFLAVVYLVRAKLCSCLVCQF
ncbi:serine/threonine-protein kinase PRP4 homolog [Penaeus japonicus]|uniref:serine/threonine-protein kinase PRP4 homolog n=1 Tax=Penaeus japonicus TaxID=27405 RepID=UPI001C712D30|nr:serine/threonine-protein kinase PRP4 homolog [Penaeus japonicus]